MKQIKKYEFRMMLPVVQRKLKSFTSDEMNELSETILNIGDVQKHNTNVKASMSDWYLHMHNPLVKKLCDKAINIVETIHPTSFNPPKFYTRKCWGAVYGKGDFTAVHNHTPNVYSWCFYVCMPKGSSPLVFPEADLTIQPNEKDIIIFSGLARHSVPPCQVNNRIVIAGNIGVM